MLASSGVRLDILWKNYQRFPQKCQNLTRNYSNNNCWWVLKLWLIAKRDHIPSRYFLKLVHHNNKRNSWKVVSTTFCFLFIFFLAFWLNILENIKFLHCSSERSHFFSYSVTECDCLEDLRFCDQYISYFSVLFYPRICVKMSEDEREIDVESEDEEYARNGG